ncbi:Uncharacterised protein [Enterococcus hirae]|uniref:hypothetical protein n=1 Tax=Enterococcus hirae TaxID=1354 RepID=UPI0010272DDB|nr:hypothetical protein [Enterococcus hirae]VFA56508.1 Uncharacterised protein [Enterococcus hirae]VTS68752.1 Uncharacterised protein [Enterococcus hirae]
MVKRSIVVDQLSKKNLGRIKYGLLFLFISGSITGITSIYLSHNQEKTVASKQKQVANIIDTKNLEKEEILTHSWNNLTILVLKLRERNCHFNN